MIKALLNLLRSFFGSKPQIDPPVIEFPPPAPPPKETHMKVTAKQLTTLFPKSGAVAEQYAALFNELFPIYGVVTADRINGFISQVGHESAGFTRLVENLNYSAQGLADTWKNRYSTGKTHMVDGKRRNEPNALALSLHRKPEAIANNCYANRLGNGPEESGDGWKFRGRGLIMITGRYNCTVAGKTLNLDLENKPELLEEPRNAVIASLDYWQRNDLNRVADKQDVVKMSKLVNGGNIGLAEREELFEKGKKVFV